jgi:hypothetical protein
MNGAPHAPALLACLFDAVSFHIVFGALACANRKAWLARTASGVVIACRFEFADPAF